MLGCGLHLYDAPFHYAQEKLSRECAHVRTCVHVYVTPILASLNQCVPTGWDSQKKELTVYLCVCMCVRVLGGLGRFVCVRV